MNWLQETVSGDQFRILSDITLDLKSRNVEIITIFQRHKGDVKTPTEKGLEVVCCWNGYVAIFRLPKRRYLKFILHLRTRLDKIVEDGDGLK